MADEFEIKNAIIRSATITIGERDLLTCYLELDYGGSGQSFGGYVLLPGPSFTSRKAAESGPNYAGIFIEQILRIAGVESWEDLPGKTIRAKASWGKVKAIGHIVKDKWFDPEEAFEALKKAA